MSEKSRVGLALVCLFLFAFAIRVWYGTLDLRYDRFFDERFTMENVSAVLTTHRIEPGNGYYPTMSYHALILMAWDQVERLTDRHWLELVDKPNNYIPILGSSALVLGYLVDELLKATSGLGPRLGRVATWTVSIALGGMLLSPGYRFAERSVTPATGDLIRLAVEPLLEPAGGRTLLLEPWPTLEPAYELRRGYGRGQVSERLVPALADLPLSELDAADAEIFPRAQLDGPHADFYRSRVARVAPERVFVVEPRRFSVLGPALVAIAHPPEAVGEAEFFKLSPRPDAATVFAGPLPVVGPDAPRVSLAFWLPLAPGAPPAAVLYRWRE